MEARRTSGVCVSCIHSPLPVRTHDVTAHPLEPHGAPYLPSFDPVWQRHRSDPTWQHHPHTYSPLSADSANTEFHGVGASRPQHLDSGATSMPHSIPSRTMSDPSSSKHNTFGDYRLLSAPELSSVDQRPGMPWVIEEGAFYSNFYFSCLERRFDDAYQGKHPTSVRSVQPTSRGYRPPFVHQSTEEFVGW